MKAYLIVINHSLQSTSVDKEWIEAESYIQALNKLRMAHPYARFTLLKIDDLCPLDWTSK